MAISKKLETIYHNGQPDGIRSIRRQLSTMTTYVIPRPLLSEAKKLTGINIRIRIAKVPDGKDPDEYIKTYGADKFAELLKNTKSRFEYNSDAILAKYDLNLPQDKIKALHEIEKLISETYSTAERDIYIRLVAQKFEVDPKSIKADVERIIQKGIRTFKKEESTRIMQDSIGYSDKVNPDYMKAPAAAKNEESVIGLLYLFPEHRKYVFEGELLSSDDFVTELNRRFFEFMKDAYFNGEDNLSAIGEAFSEDELGRLVKMKLKRMELTDNDRHVVDDAVAALKKSVVKKASQKTNTYEGLNAILQSRRKNET